MKRIQEYFLCFMFCSILGWIYEVFLEVVVYRWGFSNRGVLTGPYCVVYGFGAANPVSSSAAGQPVYRTRQSKASENDSLGMCGCDSCRRDISGDQTLALTECQSLFICRGDERKTGN